MDQASTDVLKLKSATQPRTAASDTAAPCAEALLKIGFALAWDNIAPAVSVAESSRCHHMDTAALGLPHRLRNPRGTRKPRRRRQSQRSPKYEHASSDESQRERSVRHLLRAHEIRKPSCAKSNKEFGSTTEVTPKRKDDAVATFRELTQAYEAAFLQPLPQHPPIGPVGQLRAAPADKRDYHQDFLPSISQLPFSVAQSLSVPADARIVMPQAFSASPAAMSNIRPLPSATVNPYMDGSHNAQAYLRGSIPTKTASNRCDASRDPYNMRPSSPVYSLPQLRATLPNQVASRLPGAPRHSVSWARDVNWRSTSSGSRASRSTTENSTASPAPVAAAVWKEPSALCLAMCLAAAALISFWAFYAIADVIIAGHDISEDSGDPFTVQPQDDSVISLSRNRAAHQYGPHESSGKPRFRKENSVYLSESMLAKNVSDDSNEQRLLQ